MRKKLLAVFALMTVGAVPVAAEEPDRPVLEATIQASPASRLEAARFVRTSYPGLPQDLYSQLKATYPDLEHRVVDAGLATWRQHPGEIIEIAGEVKERFGPRIKVVRMAVKEEMEASYPDFHNRLKAVLEEHGPASRWRSFVVNYHEPLVSEARQEVESNVPEFKGWYPGKFRDMVMGAEPGSTPVLDKLSGIVTRNPELGPRIATRLVSLTRRYAPGLAEDVTRHFLDNRGRLVDALKAEFPGGADKVVAVIEKTDPGLPGEVWAFVRERNSDLRADLRENLEAELPEFEDKVRGALTARYPDLQQQLLSILRD